jgi:hypothetical protein
MNLTKKTFRILATTALLSGITTNCAFADLQSPANAFTLSPQFSMDSGDYGSGDTINTYAMSITGSYDFSSRWNLSVSVVPYLHQNETYTDVVLIGGQPVHHTDYIGGNPHHSDTQIQAPGLQAPTSIPIPNISSPGSQTPSTPQPNNYIPTPPQPATQTPSINYPASNGPNNLSRAVGGETTEQVVKRHGSASGIGDAFVNLSYKLFEENDAIPEVSLHAGIKLPTADEDKGLGTGEYDYQMGVGLGKGIGRWFLYGGLDYNILGDPEYYDLDNYISGYTSVSTGIFDNMEVSLQLSAAQAATDVSDDSLSLGIGMNYLLEKYGMITAGLQKGLTDGSPDYSITVGYSISF